MADPGADRRTLGRYELLYLLGQGGMGEVHLARITGAAGFEKLCIVKTILPRVKADPQFVERFQHEAKLVTHLTHSSIAQVYDMGEADGTMFMAIEYVAGVDLSRVQDRVRSIEAQIPLPVALFITRQMLEALGYAHRKPGADGKSMGIVHRDVSPQNVMVSYEGEVKVIDFGLAKSSARSKATLPSTVLGKLGYMAPEQALAREVDHRGDIFSAGIVAWELLTGRPLYEGGTLAEMMAKMANPNIPSIQALRPEVSPTIEAAVMRALATDPAQRYARADEFARVLNECMVKENLTIGAEDVGNYVRTMCPEEFAAERKLRSRLSSAQKKKSGVVSASKISSPATAAALGATMMRPGSGGQAMTPAQRALSIAEAPEADGPPPQPRPRQTPPPEPPPPEPPPPARRSSAPQLPGPRLSGPQAPAGAPQQSKGAIAGLLLGLVVLAGGGAAAVVLLREPEVRPVVAPPAQPDPPAKPEQPLEPQGPAKAGSTEQAAAGADAGEAVAEAPAQPQPLGRVEVKKPLPVLRDRGELWVKTEKKSKVRIGDTFKVVGAPLPDRKKERDWYAEGTVMEKKGPLARISLEPQDAPLPKEIAAVPAAKEANLKRRLARDAGKPDEKQADALDAGAAKPEAKSPLAALPDAGAAEPKKPERKILTGTLQEGALGVNVTNTTDYAWTRCKMWRPPRHLYVWPEDYVLEPGDSDSIGKGKFEEQPKAPDKYDERYHLVVCKEAAGYLTNK